MDCSAKRHRKILTAALVAGMAVLPFLPVPTNSVEAANAAATYSQSALHVTEPMAAAPHP
jgi:hypothetical protein